MNMERVTMHAGEFTARLIEASLSDEPQQQMREVFFSLETMGLTEAERHAVIESALGNVTALFTHLVPEGVSRRQFVASVRALTLFADLEQAVRNLPRTMRGFRKGKKK